MATNMDKFLSYVNRNNPVVPVAAPELVVVPEPEPKPKSTKKPYGYGTKLDSPKKKVN